MRFYKIIVESSHELYCVSHMRIIRDVFNREEAHTYQTYLLYTLFVET